MADDLAQKAAEFDPHTIGNADAIDWNFHTNGDVIDKFLKIEMRDNIGRQMVLNVFNDLASLFFTVGKHNENSRRRQLTTWLHPAQDRTEFCAADDQFFWLPF